MSSSSRILRGRWKISFRTSNSTPKIPSSRVAHSSRVLVSASRRNELFRFPHSGERRRPRLQVSAARRGHDRTVLKTEAVIEHGIQCGCAEMAGEPPAIAGEAACAPRKIESVTIDMPHLEFCSQQSSRCRGDIASTRDECATREEESSLATRGTIANVFPGHVRENFHRSVIQGSTRSPNDRARGHRDTRLHAGWNTGHGQSGLAT